MKKYTLRKWSALAMSVTSFLALSGFSPAALDHSRRISGDGFLLTPLFDSQKAVVHFLTFEEEVSEEKELGGLKWRRVRLVPAAVINGSLDEKARREGLTLLRESTFSPADQICSASEDLLRITSSLPEAHQPKVLGGSYTEACTLTFKYSPESSKEVEELAASGRFLELEENYSLCGTSSERIDKNVVLERLTRLFPQLEESPYKPVPLWQAVFALADLANNELSSSRENSETLFQDLVARFHAELGEQPTLRLKEESIKFPWVLCGKEVIHVSH